MRWKVKYTKEDGMGCNNEYADIKFLDEMVYSLLSLYAIHFFELIHDTGLPFFFFQGTDKLSRQNMSRVKLHLAIVYDCKTIWLLYSTRMDACAYNIDNLYNTRQIDPPGMVRIVYTLCMHYTYTGE